MANLLIHWLAWGNWSHPACRTDVMQLTMEPWHSNQNNNCSSSHISSAISGDHTPNNRSLPCWTLRKLRPPAKAVAWGWPHRFRGDAQPRGMYVKLEPVSFSQFYRLPPAALWDLHLPGREGRHRSGPRRERRDHRRGNKQRQTDSISFSVLFIHKTLALCPTHIHFWFSSHVLFELYGCTRRLNTLSLIRGEICVL